MTVQTLNVALGERSYPIHIGEQLIAQAGERIAVLGRRAVVVTDTVVARYFLASLQRALQEAGLRVDSIVVSDGEAHKSWSTLYEVHTRLLELRAERSTVLVALGGGVIGDLGGFAAATYQRGMPLVQVPTTLLAQVDSSVGGKTAVNHPLGKNMIGAFYQPSLVLIDTASLGSLAPREFAAGLAEVIKYGAVRDVDFFAWLEKHVDAVMARHPDAIANAVFQSCRIKAEVVAADERETGERALLNFGHTFGHAIETGMGYGQWLHGEAVAAGMVIAARLSVEHCGLPAEQAARLVRLIERAGLPTHPPALALERWIELMALDKKVVAGTTRFVLLDALGKGVVRSDVSESEIGRAIIASGEKTKTAPVGAALVKSRL